MKESERWQQIKEIVYRALQREPGERDSFLAKECAGDEDLRKEVESLLAAHDEAESFFQAPAAEIVAEAIANNQSDNLAGKSLGHYQVIEVLGAGGMGEVYLARDTRLDRKVALKLLPENLTADEQFKQRFIREAKTASALNHPHIITIYEVAADNGHNFIAMEYVEGETFRDLLSRGKLETKRAVEFTAQIASGLAAAHEAGIIHRDIKPENIMVTRNSQIKILDFGLAKLVENRRISLADSAVETAHFSEAVNKVDTIPGTILGTVAYMSPEQAEGRSLDRRTDIFSLGVVFYEILAGKKPFDGKSVIDTLHSIINDEPTPVVELNPQLPIEVTDLLGKALAKEPHERYQHAGDFELDLRRFKRALETNSLISARVQQTAKPSVRGVRTFLPWIFAGGLLALTVVFAFWIWKPVAPPSNASDLPQTIALDKAVLTPLTIDPGFEGEPTFAPDGQTIAYVSDRTGNFEIFLRQIAGGPDINLTNNAADDMQPAFSPDGKQIVFVSSRTGESDCLCFFIYGTEQPLMGGAIWVMPALGGTPRRIIETGTFPSWSPDGSSIIFTQGSWYGQKIFRVAAVGGEPQEISVKFKAAAPFLAYPSYSPDGRWIVFEAANKIFVVSAEGGEASLIVEGKHPVWTADAKTIIYTNVEAGKNHTLWQVPFSTAEGKPSGNPAPLTVGRGRDTQMAVSRDGKLIAFSALDVSFNLESLPFNAETGRQAGTPQPITSGSDLIYFFNPSPDGASAVFDSNRGASSFIWRIDRGSPATQLTSNPNYGDVFPRWSPDGRTIAFDRKPANEPEAVNDLWFMEADGANPRLVKEKAGITTWMPDGHTLAYLSFEDGQLYLYDTTTKNARKITSEKGIYGGFAPSPDGKWVAFMSIAGGNVDIRAVPVEGGESISVVATPRQDFHPIISPSGKWLYFQLDHKNLYRVPGPAQNWQKAEPEKVTDFSESGLFLEDPKFSRDGRQLLYSRRRTSGDIWIMRLGQ